MNDPLLRAIAERFGTPTYVYDLDLVRRRLADLRTALPQASIYYAVKANPNGQLLHALARRGVGAEVITLGELERAIRAGIRPRSLLLGGPRQDLAMVSRAAALRPALASLDTPGQWRDWQLLAAPDTRFLVRVNPALEPGTHRHLATGAADSKFGLPPAAALALARELRAAGRLAGFHVHAGSMIRDATVIDAIGAVLEPLYAALPGCPLVDLGGGLAVPDFPLAAFAQRVRRLAARLQAKALLEPGRYLVAEAGTLLTRVLHVKRQGPRSHLIADAGMAELLRPALYGAEQPIRVIAPAPGAPPPATATTDVDGPLCENADSLGRDRTLPGAAAGALLAVAEAGAYGFAMASNYASSLRPAEVVVDSGAVQLARRRERPEDLWRLEQELGS